MEGLLPGFHLQYQRQSADNPARSSSMLQRVTPFATAKSTKAGMAHSRIFWKKILRVTAWSVAGHWCSKWKAWLPAFRCSIKRLLPIFWKEEKIRCYHFLFEKSTDCVTDFATEFALIIGRRSLILQMKALIKTFHLPYQRASGHLLLESYYHLLRMEMSSEMSLSAEKPPYLVVYLNPARCVYSCSDATIIFSGLTASQSVGVSFGGMSMLWTSFHPLTLSADGEKCSVCVRNTRRHFTSKKWAASWGYVYSNRLLGLVPWATGNVITMQR